MPVPGKFLEAFRVEPASLDGRIAKGQKKRDKPSRLNAEENDVGKPKFLGVAVLGVLAGAGAGCDREDGTSTGGAGGATAIGGAEASGGSHAVGGGTTSTGGVASGGTPATGGAPASGGVATTGGATSTGGALTGGQSSAGGAPVAGTGGACSVPEQGAPPFATTLRFTNPGPDPRWLWWTPWCDVKLTVTSCSDGYQAPVRVIDLDVCNPVCPTCGAACSPCPTEGVLVTAGGYRDVAWNGYDPIVDTVPYGDSGVMCGCNQLRNAPAGLYRVSVPVWTSDPSSGGGYLPLMDPAYTATRDFALDHAGGIVEVSL